MIVSAGSVLTGTVSLGAGWVEVVGDRVVDLGSGPSPRPVDLDLPGATVTPGFVDMHVHGGGGGAFPEATASAVASTVTLHRRHGTTAMMASLVSEHPATLPHQVTALADHVDVVVGDLVVGIADDVEIRGAGNGEQAHARTVGQPSDTA